MDAAIVLNVYSGPKRRTAHSRVVDTLLEQNCKAQVFPCSSGRAVTACAEDLVRQGVPLIVAAGGDGTVSTVAQAVLGSSSTLGILPTGTFNHFARDVGIPVDLPAAVSTLQSTAVRLVDTAAVNGRTFVNTSSIGLYPLLAADRERYRRRGISRLDALVASAVSTLKSFDRLYARVRAADAVWEGFTPFIFVGNNEYSLEGGMAPASRPSLEDGKLFVCVSSSTTRLRFLKLGVQAWLRGLSGNPDFHSIRTTELSVDCDRRWLPVSLDGEVSLLKTPLHYVVRPASLRVRVP